MDSGNVMALVMLKPWRSASGSNIPTPSAYLSSPTHLRSGTFDVVSINAMLPKLQIPHVDVIMKSHR